MDLLTVSNAAFANLVTSRCSGPQLLSVPESGQLCELALLGGVAQKIWKDTKLEKAALRFQSYKNKMRIKGIKFLIQCRSLELASSSQ